MKLAAKTALVLMTAICAAVALYGSEQVERESRRFESELRDSLLSIGRLFRPTIARTFRNEGELSAKYLVEYTEQTVRSQEIQSRMDLRIVWLDGAADEAYAPRAPLADLTSVVAGREYTTHILGPDGEPRMVSYVPVALGIDAERPAALEISASLAPLRTYTQRTIRSIAMGLVALLLVCGVLTLLIGAWLIGRPVSHLVAAARRIGSGDLSTRIRLRQRDELGAVAGAMNHMAEDLSAAHTRIAEETEARIRAIEQHASRRSAGHGRTARRPASRTSWARRWPWWRGARG